MTPEELASVSGILFKETAEWRRAYRELKAVLDSRQHITNKPR